MPFFLVLIVFFSSTSPGRQGDRQPVHREGDARIVRRPFHEQERQEEEGRPQEEDLLRNN